MPRQDGPRVNRQIRARRVLLIDSDGTQLGQFQPPDALELAKQQGLDLVEVAPSAQPPVCRIADYGKLKYEKSKREAAARRRRQVTRLKEVKLRPKTDDHDYKVVLGRARRFLKDGDKVKVTVRFRGREHAHHDIGRDRCLDLAEACEDLGRVELRPRMEGRQMSMILVPQSAG